MKHLFVPLYVWFGVGYGVISLFMAVVNFGMLAITLLTVKGINVPRSLAIFAIVVSIICICIGFFFVRYNIQRSVASYQNQQMNPEMKQIAADVAWLKEKLK